EAARVHHAAGRRGRMAARGARAAACDAGDRISRFEDAGHDRRPPPACISPSLERERLCRGGKCRDPLSLGRQSTRSIAGPGHRLGSPTGGRHRRDREQPRRISSQGGNIGDPYRVCDFQDPIGLGLVASVARPGGNATGINFPTTELPAKRLQLLREWVPAATRVAVLVNPNNPNAEATLREVAAAGRAMGMEIAAFKASTSREIDAAFASFDRPHALFVGGDGFFVSRRVQLTSLANRHGIPAIFSPRDFAEAGGLITYGSDILDSYRQVGVYSGRILKGAKPADLPVVQSTKFELVINAQIARMLGITVPATLLASANEVIE